MSQPILLFLGPLGVGELLILGVMALVFLLVGAAVFRILRSKKL